MLVAIIASEIIFVLNLWPHMAGVLERVIIGAAAVWFIWFAIKLHLTER